MRKKRIVTAIVFIACGLLLSLGNSQRAEAAFGGGSDAKLGNDDCVKCHTTIVQQVQEAGNKHKSEVSCMECHDGKHPPGTEKGTLIPACSSCHEGEPHFELANCVSCHMPKVEGSFSSIIETKTHSFHGFAGAHFHSEMLGKYVNISILRNIDHFIVNVDNQSSHALLLHPARMAVLKISVTRDKETTELEKEVFVRVLGKDGKPSMPWMADSIIKDTMIQANEKRAVRRDFKLQKGDRVDVVLGWFLVNPKALEPLGLKDEKTAKEFKVFKKESFTF